MRRGLVAGLVVLALCLVAPAVAAAQTLTWTDGSGDGTWTNSVELGRRGGALHRR